MEKEEVPIKDRLIKVLVRTREHLSSGELLCVSGTDLIDQTQNLFLNLQILHPRLEFFHTFLEQQIEVLGELKELGTDQLTRLDQFLEIKREDGSRIYQSLLTLLERLRNINLDNSLLNNNNNNNTLFDYIDESTFFQLFNEYEIELEDLEKMRFILNNKLDILINHYGKVLQQFQEDHASISLDESGVMYAKDRTKFQTRQATIMAQALMTISNHYHGCVEALKSVENGLEEFNESQLFVLERDTDELGMVHEELDQSYQIIESVREDAIVRQQLYQVVYQEKVQFFKELNQCNSIASNLCLEVKNVDDMLNGNGTIEDKLESLWGLGSSYEDFIEAYHRCLEELERRISIKHQHELWKSQIDKRLSDMYDEEFRQRSHFLLDVEPHLPGDLAKLLQENPIRYEVIEINSKQVEDFKEKEEDLIITQNDLKMGSGLGLISSSILFSNQNEDDLVISKTPQDFKLNGSNNSYHSTKGYNEEEEEGEIQEPDSLSESNEQKTPDPIWD